MSCPSRTSTPGWSAKLFRIMQIEIKDNDEVYVVAREYSASVYTQAVLSPAAVVAQSNLPDPVQRTRRVGSHARLRHNRVRCDWPMALSSPRIRVGWTAPTEVYAQRGQCRGADPRLRPTWVGRRWTSWLPSWAWPGCRRCKTVSSYNVRIRAINSIGVRGAWSQGTVQVVGKTAPPSDVPWLRLDGERLTWGPVSRHRSCRLPGALAARWQSFLVGCTGIAHRFTGGFALGSGDHSLRSRVRS
jgi:hypothetical protein